MAKIIELDESQPRDKQKKNVSKVKQTRNKSEEIAGVSVLQRIIAVIVIITGYIYGRDYFLNRFINEEFETFASVSEYINERSAIVPCSNDYGNEFKECIPEKCGRFVTDSVISKQEAGSLRKLAEKGMRFGGGSGGATILDLHSGALSVGDKFVNIYSLTAKNNKPVFTNEDFELYKAVKDKIHKTVAQQFGVDPNILYLTKPTFFSRMTAKPAVTLHDEYWHPHIDKVTYGSFYYTSLLYLSDSVKDFSGGRFVFLDKDINSTVEPRVGRLSFFTSGSENEHFVEKVEGVTSILSSTVGLLWNKVRDKTAEKLKDGDVTDAKIRAIVVRNLNDVKTKLDGLSRTDLLSSYHFLKEGVDLLNVALDETKANDEENTSLDEAQSGRGKASGMSSSVECDILNDALELSDTMRKVKTKSHTEIEAAKKRFEAARKTATRAFCSEALSIEDRIFAAKLRVVSEILECLESPKTASTGCLSFLQELHSLPSIQDIFAVFLDGGFKALLNKAERVENVKSVMLINYALYQFVSTFSNKYCSGLVWPTIKIVGGSLNPILDWQKVSSRIAIGEELFQPPNVLKHVNGFKRRGVLTQLSAVNSHCEIILANSDDIEIISRIKEPKVVKLPPPGRNESKGIEALAVDEYNNVFVLRLLRKRTESNDMIESYVLYILDKNYRVKRYSAFNFEATGGETELQIAVNKNNDIIMNKADDPHVYVCDNSGHLKHKFVRDSSRVTSISISKNNEIMIPSNDRQAVRVYTEEGVLKSTIEVPIDHNICDAAFSFFAVYKIMILTFNPEEFSYFLLVYSETGELESSIFVSNFKTSPSLKSHPSGPVAIIKRGTITYI